MKLQSTFVYSKYQESKISHNNSKPPHYRFGVEFSLPAYSSHRVQLSCLLLLFPLSLELSCLFLLLPSRAEFSCLLLLSPLELSLVVFDAASDLSLVVIC
ncbi:hypothetical protein AVEN_169777-1 [Araneus ventricosus]|uniref:Uncharacterized protein n=1 Tax=Araneus ventricosus TaxID=182803 RepID=A0A4Y2HLI8_ARAVE|nr:hypothetical protein AVEN_169777-1 [Araneus ventricosus]